jgi:undecaprenyl-diphosphatase
VLLLLLVLAGWPPCRNLDARTAEALNQFGTDHPELVKSAEVVSEVFDPNVFRVALTVIALVYLIHGERHHATWLVVTVFGGAGLGFALKEIVGRARPVLPDPVSTAPGMSFPSGHALGASIGCCLLLLIALRFLPRGGRVAAVLAAGLIVGSVGLARVVLGVHFVSDVLAGTTLGVGLGGRDDMGLRRVASRGRAAGRAAGRCGHPRPANSTALTCKFSDPIARESINGGVGIPQHDLRGFRWHRP